MKILCEYTAYGPSYVRSGWGRVFASLGDEFVFWEPAKKPALDMFNEFEPDIFLGTTYGLDRAVHKAIVARPELKVAMTASAWGALADQIPPTFPITRVTYEEKVKLEKLKKESGKPDFVFSHVTESCLEGLLGGWNNLGIKSVGILNAADIIQYRQGKYRDELACDVGFIGGYWGYKAENLTPYMLPLCYDKKLQVKIFGNQAWPVAQYLGELPENDSSDFFCSATVCPSISEPHSTSYHYDLIERPFKVMVAGGFCISDPVKGWRELFTNDELIVADNLKEFHELLYHFIDNKQERQQYISAGQKAVVARHSYHHRVFQMLSLFEMHNKANACMLAHASLLHGGVNEAD